MSGIQRIIDVFEQTLRVHGITEDDNFFDLGGHSLLVIEAVDALERDAGLVVPVETFLLEPTPHQLAAHVD
jgi:glyine---[glycyl-carrier protein] ligase